MSSADATRERGFTLIEIMVALAVFSLAVMALVRLENANVRGAATLSDTLVAGLVARNVAVDALGEPRAPTLGHSAGAETNGGRRWVWQRDVTPTGDPRIVRVAVAVGDGRGAVLARAVAVRPPDVESPQAPGSPAVPNPVPPAGAPR